MAYALPNVVECCQTCCEDTTVEVPSTDTFITFDTKLALRAYLTPRPDRMFIALLGGVTLGDGAGGLYYYDASSLAADDDGVTIRPDDLSALQAGRWRMHGS